MLGGVMMSTLIRSKLFTILTVASLIFIYSTVVRAAAKDKDVKLFEYKGKVFSAADLPKEEQSMFYEVEREFYREATAIIEGAVIKQYFTNEAAKGKKTIEQLETETFTVADPSEDEKKAWYEQNKTKVNESYEKVKEQIKQFLVAQKRKEKKDQLLAKIKGQKGSNFEIMIKEPRDPKATTGKGTLSVVLSSTLFKFGGKSYRTADLAPALQQNFFDIKSERYERLKYVIESSAVKLYIEEEAKTKNKSTADMETELLGAVQPTDAEIQTWYDQNKAKVNYPLDKVKGQISQFLASQRKKEKHDKLLAEIKGKVGYKVLAEEPEAPTLPIDVSGFPTKGNTKTKVTMVEFADYQCGHCQHASEIIKNVLDQYKDKVRFVYIDFPLRGLAGLSAVLAEGGVCAAEQGKYWEYHDLAFKRQDLKEDGATVLAKELKLDEAKFQACLTSPKPKQVVKKGRDEGEKLAITGTPAIFINGKRITGYNEDVIKKGLDAALKKAK